MALDPIKGNQIPKYDAISREIEKAASILEAISYAGLNADAANRLMALRNDLRVARHDFFSAGRSAFLRARAGEE